ncbi:MAG: flagellar motor switch protein FliN [Gammaproteobacteria bacterium]|nr:flagellar motor switch protein FliN [Gammaproteobacteria bacterium]
MSDDDELGDEWAQALNEQQVDDAAVAAQPAAQAVTATTQAEIAPLQTLQPDSAPGEGEVNIENILDIPLAICMEVGKTKISIRNLLQLNQGSVVELDRLAGEPLDVTVNGTLIAHGEVVVINEKFGIRLTDVVSPMERIKNLK